MGRSSAVAGATILALNCDRERAHDERSGGRKGPGSLAFDRTIADVPGCVLWFGPWLVLERVHSGKVGDLEAHRVRPSLIDG